MLFINIYNKLCETRKENKHLYKPFSGLHAHHIIPKHSGGTEDYANFTYLTVREHIIAHYLLWKIYKTPNDLRAMKMLGANLSLRYRKTVGEFCRDNGIGVFSENYTPEMREETGRKVGLWAVENKVGIHTDDQKLRSSWASLGGKVGGTRMLENKVGIHTDDQELRSSWAVKGGKSCSKIPMWCNGEINKRAYERPSPEWFRGIIKKKDGNLVVYNYEFIDLLKSMKPKGHPPMWTNGSKNKRSWDCPGNGWFPGVIKRHQTTGELVVYKYN